MTTVVGSATLVAVFALTSCGLAIRPPQPTPIPSPLTIQGLANAEYNIDPTAPRPLGPVLLHDGSYRQDDPGSRVFINFVGPVAFGDLDGDGVDDAVTILSENLGGSGIFMYLAAVVNRGGHPVNVNTAYLGDRVKVEALSIHSGTIAVDLLVQGPGQGLCCPNLPISEQYQLQANRLTKIRASGSSSAAPILASHQP